MLEHALYNIVGFLFIFLVLSTRHKERINYNSVKHLRVKVNRYKRSLSQQDKNSCGRGI